MGFKNLVKAGKVQAMSKQVISGTSRNSNQESKQDQKPESRYTIKLGK